MTNINLHKILCRLVNDDDFLTIIETENIIPTSKQTKKNNCDFMSKMIVEYVILSPYEIQGYDLLPQCVKRILTPEFRRLGIYNIGEKDIGNINISFLNSLNMLLRPELYKSTYDEQKKNCSLLQNVICKLMESNYQIDKVKNTRKVKLINQQYRKNLCDGKLSHELIQYIVNIFEINLIVFDLTKMETFFYWACGTVHPHINFFNDIFCMSYIRGNYEPIITSDLKNINKIYIYQQILSNKSEIISFPEIDISLPGMIYLSTWDLNIELFIELMQKKIPNVKNIFQEIV